MGIQNVVTINGDDTPSARAQKVAQFSQSATSRVMLVSAAANTGINLSAGSIGIILVWEYCPSVVTWLINVFQERNWCKSEDEQCIGRLHRPPQERNVVFYRILVNNTSDIILERIASQKHRLHCHFLSLPIPADDTNIDIEDDRVQSDGETSFSSQEMDCDDLHRFSNEDRMDISVFNELAVEGVQTKVSLESPETRESPFTSLTDDSVSDAFHLSEDCAMDSGEHALSEYD